MSYTSQRALNNDPVFTGTIETPAIKITTGAGASKVLTSAADGTASWGTAGGVAADQLVIATVELSAAEINAMYVTPKILIADPGDGYAIVLDQAIVAYNYGGTQFTGGGTVRICYTGTSTHILSALSIDAIMTGGTSSTLRAHSMTVGTGGITVTPSSSIEMSNSTASFATGNGTIKTYLRYRIVTL